MQAEALNKQLLLTADFFYSVGKLYLIVITIDFFEVICNVLYAY